MKYSESEMASTIGANTQRLYLCRGPFKELLRRDAGDVERIVCV